MAESMPDIRRHIKSVTGTEHITNAMKLVSAAKFKKAKDAFDRTDKHIEYILKTIDELLADYGRLPEIYEFTPEKEIRNSCFIVITSGKGLCGSFNVNVIKKAEEFLGKESENDVIHMYSIGSKGRDYFAQKGIEITSENNTSPEEITFAEVCEIAEPILEDYKNGIIDEIVVVYTAFINSLDLEPRAVRLLPVSRDIEKSEEPVEVEYAPSQPEVLEYLLPKYFEMMLYKAVIESAASEHIARRTAMDKATDNAREMLNQLELKYNRARQASITNELIEIVAGADAQS